MVDERAEGSDEVSARAEATSQSPHEESGSNAAASVRVGSLLTHEKFTANSLRGRKHWPHLSLIKLPGRLPSGYILSKGCMTYLANLRRTVWSCTAAMCT